MKQSDKTQLEWLASFYKEAADTGREIQHSPNGKSAWAAAVRGPSTDSSPPHWRLKPVPQKAFLVWVGDSRWPAIFDTREAADLYCQLNPAPTQIQEVERAELP